MILTDSLFQFLEVCLSRRPLLFPTPVDLEFSGGWLPTHLDCYGTARRVETEFGWPVIAGITMLEKCGKLYPWPHMVNAQGELLGANLVDASPQPREPNLGFLPIRLNETQIWNDLTAAYARAEPRNAMGSSWGCGLADLLTDRHLEPLREKALIFRSNAVGWEIPRWLPKAGQAA